MVATLHCAKMFCSVRFYMKSNSYMQFHKKNRFYLNNAGHFASKDLLDETVFCQAREEIVLLVSLHH